MSLGRFRCRCTGYVRKRKLPIMIAVKLFSRLSVGLNNMYMRCIRCADNLTTRDVCSYATTLPSISIIPLCIERRYPTLPKVPLIVRAEN